MARWWIIGVSLASALGLFILTASVHSQTPADPTNMNERKLFDFPESTGASPVFYGVVRIAWVDETTILATVRQPSGLQVRLINIATGTARDVGQGGCASLSPDRSMVAWVRGPGHTPTGDVWIHEIRSIQARQLTIDAVQEGERTLEGSPVRASCLTWSPDGRRLAITTGGVLSRGPLLIVVVANGQVQGKIEGQGLQLGYPAWSPDGDRLAFKSETVGGGEANRIDTFDFRRGMRSKLVDVPSKYGAENLVYSPDGRDLLFNAIANVGGQHIFAFDGSRLRNLVAGWSPTWHPDRRTLTFVRGNSVYAVGQ